MPVAECDRKVVSPDKRRTRLPHHMAGNRIHFPKRLRDVTPVCTRAADGGKALWLIVTPPSIDDARVGAVGPSDWWDQSRVTPPAYGP
jgi:hypothetical protein